MSISNNNSKIPNSLSLLRKSYNINPASVSVMRKRLIIDFESIASNLQNRRIDNVEGMCFGPKLPNGNLTLVVVSDDNFNPSQVTQFIAFEVLP